jgi:hypothetical protein
MISILKKKKKQNIFKIINITLNILLSMHYILCMCYYIIIIIIIYFLFIIYDRSRYF